MQRDGILLQCGSARVTAALLGRFLPRLGPLAPLAALFSFRAPMMDPDDVFASADLLAWPKPFVWGAVSYSAADR